MLETLYRSSRNFQLGGTRTATSISVLDSVGRWDTSRFLIFEIMNVNYQILRNICLIFRNGVSSFQFASMVACLRVRDNSIRLLLHMLPSQARCGSITIHILEWSIPCMISWEMDAPNSDKCKQLPSIDKQTMIIICSFNSLSNIN